MASVAEVTSEGRRHGGRLAFALPKHHGPFGQKGS
jgi:hypothetical protein